MGERGKEEGGRGGVVGKAGEGGVEGEGEGGKSFRLATLAPKSPSLMTF